MQINKEKKHILTMPSRGAEACISTNEVKACKERRDIGKAKTPGPNTPEANEAALYRKIYV